MPINFNLILKKLEEILIEKKLKLSVCESCTGGLLSKVCTDFSGSSKWFLGGIVAYSNNFKETIGVKTETLNKYGSVSSQVAKEMADSTLLLINSDICLSITGIAGPGGSTINKPVGVIFYAFSSKFGYSSHKKFIFNGLREDIRNLAAEKGIQIILDCVSNINTQ